MENELWLHKGKKFQRSGPDGLEAWGVAIAASFINFIMAGINRTSGILYVEFIDAFQVDRMQASLPFTIRSVFRNLLGPVVGILGQKYGVRPIILVGGIIGTLSTIACFFANNLFWISVFWGCFCGFGTAMVMTLTQAAIGEHFSKHISTASGIGFSGGCIGSFVFPVMFECLIEEYSIQGTFLFIAGMIMHVIPAAIILKRPTWIKQKPKKQNQTLINGDIKSFANALESRITTGTYFKGEDDETGLLQKNDVILCEKNCAKGNNRRFSENDNPGYMHKNVDFDFLWKKRELLMRLLTNDNALKFPSPEFFKTENFPEDSQIKKVMDLFFKIADDIDSHSAEITNPSQFSVTTSDSEIFDSDDKDIFTKGELNLHTSETSEFNLNPIDCIRDLLEKFFERDKEGAILLSSKDSTEDLRKIIEELLYMYFLLEIYNGRADECNNFSDSHAIPNNVSSLESSAELSNTFCSHIKTAMWLHSKPLFLLTCLCRCVHFITFQPILTTVVDFSRDKGLPEQYGKYAIGTLALGDLIGRLLLGWLTDKKYLSLPRYMFIFMVLQGVFTMAIALTNSAESLLPVLTVYGLLQGCTFIQHPVLISHYMGKDEQSIALGCLNFFPGIIGFAMPFYIGYFRDTVGSYDGMFYINGSIGSFIGLLWLAEPFLMKCSLKIPQRSHAIAV